MKIGLISDSLRLPFADSIAQATKLGVTGVQKYMTGGPFAAETLTADRIREIRDIMDSNGLVFSAFCGDFGIDLVGDGGFHVVARQAQAMAGPAEDTLQDREAALLSHGAGGNIQTRREHTFFTGKAHDRSPFLVNNSLYIYPDISLGSNSVSRGILCG
jgi:hypothetical protein